MAIKLADAVVFLSGDSNELDKDLSKARAKTESWAKNLGSAVASLAGAAVVGGATLAVGAVLGIGAAAFTVSSQVDKATDQIAADLGLQRDEAERFADVITSVYGDNFTGSIEEAGAAVSRVTRAIGSDIDRLSDEELTRLTEQGVALQDAFGVDLEESMRSAVQLVRNGVVPSFDDAMDLITAGFQNGLNVADDWLDTLNEYSDDFKDLGLTGPEVLGLLNRGLEAGAFNTDKLADAINEFGVNLRDPAISDKLAEIDDGLFGLFEQFQMGEISERDALEGMLQRLKDIEDPIARDQAGVLLFRSMWEDLGEEAILAMGGIQDGLVDIEGSTSLLNQQYDNFGSMLEGVKRRALVALIPIGDKLLELANQFMPQVETAFKWLEENLPGIIDTASQKFDEVTAFISENLLPAFQDLSNWWTEDGEPFVRAFVENGLERIAPLVEGVTGAFERFRAWFDSNRPELEVGMQTLGVLAQDTFGALVETIAETALPDLRDAFDEMKTALQELGINFDQLKIPVQLVVRIIGALLMALAGIVAAVFAGIAAQIKSWATGFREIVQGVKMMVEGDIINGMLLVLRGVWDATFGAMVASTRAQIETIIRFFQNLYDRLVGNSIVPDLVKRIVELLQGMDLRRIMNLVIQGAIDGIWDMRQKLLDTASGLFSNMKDTIKGLLGISSPSRVFRMEIGRPIGQGAELGIADQLKGMGANVARMLSPDAIMPMTPALAGAGGSRQANFYGGINFYGDNAPRTEGEANRSGDKIKGALQRKGLD